MNQLPEESDGTLAGDVQERSLPDVDRGEITRLLSAHRGGDGEAYDRLTPLIHRQLEGLARRQLRRIPPGRTLDTVALVSEAYMRMVDVKDIDWQDRAHFFAVTASSMRRVVVDNARRHFAGKRGGGQKPVTLDLELDGGGAQAETVLAIHEALEQLESFNERLVKVVECRFFAGMTEEETAEALGVSVRTVQRSWRRARAWLVDALNA